MAISRRSFIATTTAAGLAASPVLSAAPLMGPSRPRFRRVTLGAFEVTTLMDGAAPVPNPHGIFGMNRPLEEVEDALAAEDFQPLFASIGFAIRFDLCNRILNRLCVVGLRQVFESWSAM